MFQVSYNIYLCEKSTRKVSQLTYIYAIEFCKIFKNFK